MTGLDQHTATPRRDPGDASPSTFSSGIYRVEMVRSVTDLEPYAAAWDGLAASAPTRVHSISHAWVSSFFEHLAPAGADCRCLLVFDGCDLVGVLPFTVSRRYFSVITKSDVCPPNNDQTFASDLVCRCKDSSSVVGAVMDGLHHFLPRAWELTFQHVSRHSQIVDCFCHGRHSVLYHVKLDGYGNYIRTDGTFDVYARALRPKFATNLRRLTRKIERLPGFDVQFLKGDEAAPGYIEDFLRLEASGWKGRAGTAILNSARESAFYRAFTKRLYERRWLEWHNLRVGGHVVASHMAIRSSPVLYLWKIAYDEDYSNHAPGNVLMLRAIEDAFASPGVEELNCLTNSPWNRDWNMERREYFRVKVWPKRALPFLTGYCRVKSQDALRRIPGARGFRRRLFRARTSLAEAAHSAGSKKKPPGGQARQRSQ
jgi:CelD/BcsL family acetyltransferase involved in cellulose biosynthesis